MESAVSGIDFTLAFECRSRSRRPTIEWVEQQIKKHEHLSDKLVLVSAQPFTRRAADLARREGADTIELSAATRVDWLARIEQYKRLLFATFDFQIKSFTAEYRSPDDARRFPDGQNASIN